MKRFSVFVFALIAIAALIPTDAAFAEGGPGRESRSRKNEPSAVRDRGLLRADRALARYTLLKGMPDCSVTRVAGTDAAPAGTSDRPSDTVAVNPDGPWRWDAPISEYPGHGDKPVRLVDFFRAHIYPPWATVTGAPDGVFEEPDPPGMK